jgi:RNA polymerase-associated protein
MVMVLYSGSSCPFSHRCRIVLFEKSMDYEIREVDLFNKSEEVMMMNPYGQVPILTDRDLIIYESNIINEYLDERFPHPQLMPPDPMTRARMRLMMHNFERELFTHVGVLENGPQKSADKAKQSIRDVLVQISPLLQNQKYLFGEEFSILDVIMAPLLWRLDHYGIHLPVSAAPLLKYGERLFCRPAFIDALTPSEKVMRR